MTGRPGVPPIERIMSRCVAGPSGCIVFTGAKSSAGYGQVNDHGKVLYAHRVVYQDTHGPIAPKMYVDHQCGTRACVNITHLRLLTASGNTQARTVLNGNNTSGHRGVYWGAKNRKWYAQIKVDGKAYSLGGYEDIEVAAKIARLARRALHEAHSAEDMA